MHNIRNKDNAVCNECMHSIYHSDYFLCQLDKRIVGLENALKESFCEDFEYSSQKTEEWGTLKELVIYCDKCGSIITNQDSSITVESDRLCNSCIVIHARECISCHHWFYRENLNHDSNCSYLCDTCREEYYICTDCNQFVHNNNIWTNPQGDIYCQTCARDYIYCIHDHNYKPDPIFYGSDNVYYGIELEIDGAGEDEENAKEVLEIANNKHDHIYIKHDSSLTRGFEIVSHPCTFEYHSKEIPWNDVLSKCKDLGYISNNTDTCGLHVHISKVAFGNNEVEQDLNIMKLLYIFEKHWSKLVIFSRREQSKLDLYAARYDLKQDEAPQTLFDKAKKGNRYHAINLKNYNTIEVRIFRGTLNYETFFATLQFCKVLIEITNKYNISEIISLTWIDIVKECLQYKELSSYLEKRNIKELY